MPIQVAAGETDDPQFITLLNSLVGGLIEKEAPQELWIIQIDNWFDHKWLRFSGIGIVAFQFSAFMNRYDAALDEFYQDKVTFPPFMRLASPLGPLRRFNLAHPKLLIP
jgi:hypothetical protein